MEEELPTSHWIQSGQNTLEGVNHKSGVLIWKENDIQLIKFLG